ncbi:5877_t:CDS:2 [Entrophospora sp. SA101]|nr:5877_t:CDS:2 [Entrophospora sp. SA101]
MSSINDWCSQDLASSSLPPYPSKYVMSAIVPISERKEGEEGDQATGDNNSIVIDINNNYNNDSDVMSEIMSEINGEKYYNGIKVPPLGARIIPLERQMEISKELSEKQNYHQYYDNQSD